MTFRHRWKGRSNMHVHSRAVNGSPDSMRRMMLALFITLGFVGVEFAAGWLANSLALLSDAVHNLTDVAALALSAYALRLSSRPANAARTFGYHRTGILIAFINSASLVLLSIWIFYEASQRLLSSPEVESWILLLVGLAAFAVNTFTAWLVLKGSNRDLNLRSAFLHLSGDALSTAGAVLAGAVMLFTGFHWLDPAISICIGILILWNAWGILREAVDILLENAPRDIRTADLIRDILSVNGVRDIHDLHIWSITKNLRALSAHIVTNDITLRESNAIRSEAEYRLCHIYNISHVTLQMETEICKQGDLYCDLQDGNQRPLAQRTSPGTECTSINTGNQGIPPVEGHIV